MHQYGNCFQKQHAGEAAEEAEDVAEEVAEEAEGVIGQGDEANAILAET